MMRVFGTVFLAAACVSVALADGITSGLAVGKGPTPFHPLNVTGENAGQKSCIVCSYGGSPVAAVFARKDSEGLAKLVKELDAAGSKGLKSFVVYLSDDESRPDEIKQFAAKNGIKNTVLAVDNVTGPKAWQIAKDAEVTVVLYNRRKVEANHSFGSGQLDAKGVAAVVANLPKILVKNNDAE